jgi:hypothetical protein
MPRGCPLPEIDINTSVAMYIALIALMALVDTIILFVHVCLEVIFQPPLRGASFAQVNDGFIIRFHL